MFRRASYTRAARYSTPYVHGQRPARALPFYYSNASLARGLGSVSAASRDSEMLGLPPDFIFAQRLIIDCG